MSHDDPIKWGWLKHLISPKVLFKKKITNKNSEHHTTTKGFKKRIRLEIFVQKAGSTVWLKHSFETYTLVNYHSNGKWHPDWRWKISYWKMGMSFQPSLCLPGRVHNLDLIFFGGLPKKVPLPLQLTRKWLGVSWQIVETQPGFDDLWIIVVALVHHLADLQWWCFLTIPRNLDSESSCLKCFQSSSNWQYSPEN